MIGDKIDIWCEGWVIDKCLQPHVGVPGRNSQGRSSNTDLPLVLLCLLFHQRRGCRIDGFILCQSSLFSNEIVAWSAQVGGAIGFVPDFIVRVHVRKGVIHMRYYLRCQLTPTL